MAQVLGARSTVHVPIHMAGTQSLEPSLLPPRVCTGRKLEAGTEPELKLGHCDWDVCVPDLASAARPSAHPSI